MCVCVMYWRLVELFFSERVLETSLHVLALSVQHAQRDAVVYTCSAAIHHPVSFCFSEEGVVPFARVPDLVIPYEYMSREQLECALAWCREVEEQNVFVCSSKMGCGFFIQVVDTDKHYIPHCLLLERVRALLERMNTPCASMHMILHAVMGECVWAGESAGENVGENVGENAGENLGESAGEIQERARARF